MAQEFLKKIINDDNRSDIKVISRGTYVLSNFTVPQKIKDFLKENNIECSKHIPMQYGKEDIESSDFIFVMTQEQLRTINDKYAQFSDKIFLFMDFCLGKEKDMKDPIDKRGSSFYKIANEIKQDVSILYKKITCK